MDGKQNEKNKTCLGFKFTEREEERMRQACASAAELMRRYGKGRKPYMIDLSHYGNTKKTKI